MVEDIKIVNAALTNAKEIKTKVQAAINGQTNKLSEVKLANQKSEQISISRLHRSMNGRKS